MRCRGSRRHVHDGTIAGVLALLILLAHGCVHYHPQPLSPTQNAADLEARTLDSIPLRNFLETNLGGPVTPWPPQPWTCSLLTLAAFYYHPDLDVVRARWAVAQAGVITAGARPNPTVAFSPEYVTNTGIPAPPWILGFSFDIPIETFGKRGYRVAQAQSLGEAARLNLAVAAWRVRSRLRASFVDLWAADKRVAWTTEQQTVQDELVRSLEHRLEVGEASALDMTRERLALDRIRLALRGAEKQVVDARSDLASAVGVPVAALDDVRLSFDDLDGPTPSIDITAQDFRREALLDRADVHGALAEYDAAQSALQLEIAKQYPDLHLGPGYRYELGENRYALGASLTLPILDQNEGPIAEAEAHRKEAAARFTALQAQIIGEIDRAIAGYRVAAEGTTAAEALVKNQETNYRQVQAGFKVGGVDRVSLLGASLEAASSRLSYLDALVQQQRALGLLEDAVQRPLPEQSGLVLAVPEADPRDEGRPRQ